MAPLHTDSLDCGVVVRPMPRQIHAVVKQAGHLDDSPRRGNPEHDEMTALSALPRHMQGANAGRDVVPRFSPQDVGALVQGLDGLCHGLNVERRTAGNRSAPPSTQRCRADQPRHWRPGERATARSCLGCHVLQVSAQGFRGIERLVASRLDIGDARLGGGA